MLAPGTPLRLSVEAYPRLAELVLPSGDRHAVEGDIEELSDGRWRLPEIPGQRTERAGLYTLALDGARDEPFAVQLDPREGDLERLSPGDLAALHPAFTVLDRGDERSRAAAQSPQRGELWRVLATLCLLFLVGESLWGAWIGQRRRLPR